MTALTALSRWRNGTISGLLLALLLLGGVVHAEVDLPDIAADAKRYQERVARAADPSADITTVLRSAKEAAQRRRWLDVVRALDLVLSRNPADGDTWLRLARAWRELDRTAAEVAAAAYNAYLSARRANLPEDGVPTEALMLIAQQFELSKRREAAIRVWAEIGRIVPDQNLADKLGAQQSDTGRLKVEPAPTPRTHVRADTRAPAWCATFSAPLDQANSSQYRRSIKVQRIDGNRNEVVSADPMINGNTLCLYGLKHGQKYHVTLRPEFAAADGRSLGEEWEEEFTIQDRQSDVAFKAGTLILPVTGNGNVPLKSVGHAGDVTLLLVHVTDRQLINEIALEHVDKGLKGSDLSDLASRVGRMVWWGTVQVNGQRNAELTTTLPIGRILNARAQWRSGAGGEFAAGFIDDGSPAEFGAGVYALIAIPGRCFGDRTPLQAAAAAAGFGCSSPANAQNSQPGGGEAKLATQWIVYTDIGLQLLRGPGDLYVAARSLQRGNARDKVRVQLVSTGNRVLAEAVTDADGIARFDAGLAKGVLGNRMRGIFAFAPDGDFAFLDAAGDSLDLSDRDVAGRPAPGPIDAYLWTERGIYRPGETVEAGLLVRDDMASALDPPPLRMRLVAPDETAPIEKEVNRFDAGGARLGMPLPRLAASGEWRLEARGPGDAVVGSTTIQVKPFVPNRIELQVEGVDQTKIIEVGQRFPVKVRANYLYGAKASGLSGVYRLSLRRAHAPFPGYEGFQFGPADSAVQEAGPIRPLPRTDAEGTTSVEVMLDTPLKTVAPAEAMLRVQLNDSDGGSVGKEFNIKLRRPDQHWIGVHVVPPAAGDDKTMIELVAVRGDGVRIPLPQVRWQVFAEEDSFQWQRDREDRPFTYQVTTNTHLIHDDTAAIGVDQPTQLTIDQPLGRYRIVVSDGETAVTRLSFTNGFEGGKRSPGRPDLVHVTLDKSEYEVGDTMAVKVVPAFPGQLMLTVVGHRLQKIINQPIETEGATIRLKPEPDWGPHPYVLATVFRAVGPDSGQKIGPARAIGAAGFRLSRPGAGLQVTIKSSSPFVPGRDLPVKIQASGVRPGSKAYVTLAAVDAGILSITDYSPPDPLRHFFGQRRLGMQFLDNYGRLLMDQGTAAAVRSGGDALGPLRGLDYTWPGIVAFHSQVLPLDSDGTLSTSVKIPDFLGRLELMAVAWTADQVGAAQLPVLVRDLVVARPDLPRFLAPGDKAVLGLELHNQDGPAGEYEVVVRGGGTLGFETMRRVRLEQKERTRIEIPVTPTELGEGTIEMVLRGITNPLITSTRKWTVAVRPAVEATTRVVRGTIAPGRALTLRPEDVKNLARDLLLETTRVRRQLTSAPQFAGQLFGEDVVRSAMSTTELSGRLALLVAASSEVGGWDQMAAPVRDAFDRTMTELVALQRTDGGFRAYPGESDSGGSGPDRREIVEALNQRTAYAADVLATAREQQMPVPVRALARAGDFLAKHQEEDARHCGATGAYALFVLVRLGRVQKDTIDSMQEACTEATPAADAQPPTADGSVPNSEAPQANPRANPRRRHLPSPQQPDGETLQARAFLAAAAYAYGVDIDGNEAKTVAALFNRADRQPPAELLQTVYALTNSRLPATTMDQVLVRAAQRLTNADPSLGLETRGKMALAAVRNSGQPTAIVDARIDDDPNLRMQGRRWQSPELRLGEITKPMRVENLGSREVVHELVFRGIPAVAPAPGPQDAVLLDRKLYRLKDGLDPDQPLDPRTPVGRNELLALVIEGKSQNAVKGLGVLTELLPAGWVIEAADLRPNLALAPEARKQLGLSDDKLLVPRREGQDDRLVALVDLAGAAQGFRIGLLVRAAHPGEFVWPGTVITSVKDPSATGRTIATRVTVKPEE